MQAHCFMGRPDTKIFDISCVKLNSINKTTSIAHDIESHSSSLEAVGVDPLDMELSSLIDHIYHKINNLL